jgi:hypothetical protein
LRKTFSVASCKKPTLQEEETEMKIEVSLLRRSAYLFNRLVFEEPRSLLPPKKKPTLEQGEREGIEMKIEVRLLRQSAYLFNRLVVEEKFSIATGAPCKPVSGHGAIVAYKERESSRKYFANIFFFARLVWLGVLIMM